MTSSTKPEELLSEEEPNHGHMWHRSVEMLWSLDKQTYIGTDTDTNTYRQTDTLIAILHTSDDSEVTIVVTYAVITGPPTHSVGGPD